MRTVPARPAAVAAAVLLALTACAADPGDDTPAEAGTAPVAGDLEPEATDGPGVDVGADSEGAAADVDAGEEADAEAGAGAQGDPAGPVRGVVTVDGVGYDITELRRCEPYEDELIVGELELQGIGEHDGERVQIDVYIEELSGTRFDSVSWAGPEGVFGSPEDAEVVLDAAGASVRGATTLVDALHQTETVVIDFDLEVPDEILDCR